MPNNLIEQVRARVAVERERIVPAIPNPNPPADREAQRDTKWRVGVKAPLNIYFGNRLMFQCHTPGDAALVVAELNSHAVQAKRIEELEANLNKLGLLCTEARNERDAARAALDPAASEAKPEPCPISIDGGTVPHVLTTDGKLYPVMEPHPIAVGDRVRVASGRTGTILSLHKDPPREDYCVYRLDEAHEAERTGFWRLSQLERIE